MKNLKQIVKIVEKFTTDNSPLILTAMGVAGTISTAILASKASVRAVDLLREVEDELWTDIDTPPTLFAQVKVVWKLYIPSVSVAAVTITSIILANRIGTRRAAAMAAAYTTLDQTFGEYKVKVIEKFGENKERAVRDEVAQDRVQNHQPNQSTTIITGKGTVPCLDLFANRWFEADMETIQKAEIRLNHKIQHSMGMAASLNEFYDILGLPNIEMGEELGWDADNILEISITAVLTDDDRPGLAMRFDTKPIRNYYRSR